MPPSSPLRARSALALPLAAALVMSLAPDASARTVDPDPDARLRSGVPARFVMGFKGGGGGTLWDEPQDTVLHRFQTGERAGDRFNLPIFDETRGGYTMSAGIFAQGIFFDHLGLEVGLHFVQHTLIEKINWTFTVTTTDGGQTSGFTERARSEHELSWTAVHVPILVKAIVPTGSTRVSLGIGPEFAFASWARTKFDIVEVDEPRERCPGAAVGEDRLPGPSRCGFTGINAKLENSVYLTLVFGIEITAGDFLIPIDIHWSYNFSQPARYLERAILDPDELPTDTDPNRHPNSVTLRTRDTMYGGIRIGIAYQFD